MKKATLQLETLTCPSCMQKIDKTVRTLDGIDKDSVNVMFNSSKLKVTFDDSVTSVEKIIDAISNLGFDVLSSQVTEA
ncbi:MAG TPA: heavy-metal-associated domain-containing protein [Bacilli bacterium]|jgi:copper chaperone|nr:heavy-metal-associated domain-containing protein [Acholeplasmataceae bacterium]HOE77544.1 heavy-metal-associated domain-containing protein [Bacilli bacterium]HON64810.1 heavy-metal-associated domain-containing protein [Bacilli bacterium]HPD12313.1 heavy-metal-associated domain-containing protein [Bacilli bacterium]HPK57798.1 heavy-metal-associated domain-containing protein [Bacilli bacterium]